MARSAARLEIALPAARRRSSSWPAWRRRVARAMRRARCGWSARAGRSRAGRPRCGRPSPAINERQLRGRREGVAVRTAVARVIRWTRAARLPALLGGAKTLSYAVNMACQRWAAAGGRRRRAVGVRRRLRAGGADVDAGLADRRRSLCTVPPASTGILAGTTARLPAGARRRAGLDRRASGWSRPADLHTADGVWLTSSVRGPAEIRALDGVPLGPSPETPRIAKLLGFPL